MLFTNKEWIRVLFKHTHAQYKWLARRPYSEDRILRSKFYSTENKVEFYAEYVHVIL